MILVLPSRLCPSHTRTNNYVLRKLQNLDFGGPGFKPSFINLILPRRLIVLATRVTLQPAYLSARPLVSGLGFRVTGSSHKHLNRRQRCRTPREKVKRRCRRRRPEPRMRRNLARRNANVLIGISYPGFSLILHLCSKALTSGWCDLPHQHSGPVRNASRKASQSSNREALLKHLSAAVIQPVQALWDRRDLLLQLVWQSTWYPLLSALRGALEA